MDATLNRRENLHSSEKEFSGTEQSVFMEDVRHTVMDLSDALVKAEAELIKNSNTMLEIDKYMTVRGYFRKLVLLTEDKIGDPAFINKCDTWLFEPVKTLKEDRNNAIKAGGLLIKDYFKILTDIGIIDIHGNSFSNKYPFAEIVYENIGIIDVDHISPFDKGVIDFIVEKFKEKSGVE